MVFDLASYTLTIFSLPLFVTAAAALLLGLLVLSAERISFVSLAFFLVTLFVAVWFFCFGWMYSARSAEVAEWWARAGYLGIPFIPASVYQFSVVVLRLQHRIRFKLLVLIAWLLAFSFSAAGLTGDLLLDGVSSYYWGYYPRYEDLGSLFVLFTFGSLLGSMPLYWTEHRESRSAVHRNRVRWLMVALSLGYVGGIDFVAAFGMPVYPFGYVGILGFLLVAAWTIWKFHLVDITPAFAAPKVLETMADGLLVLDGERTVQLVNPAGAKLLGYVEEEILGRRLEDVLRNAAFAEQWRLLARGSSVTDYELQYTTPAGASRALRLSASPMGSAAGTVATVCLLRDTTEQKLAEQALEKNVSFVELLQVVAVAANEARTVEEAMQTCLDSVCRMTGWPIGHYYTRVPGVAGRLVSTPLWHVDDPQRVRQFTRVVGSMRFASGAGLPGQVLATGRPAWATDLLQHDLFLRARLPNDSGIRSAFAFPVLVGAEVVGVMEFFSTDTVEPDQALLEVMGHIGAQLGRVVERHRAEEEIRALNEDLEKRIQERTLELEVANRVMQGEIVERKRAEAALQELATRDEVTGLLNRRELNRLLRDELNRARRYKRPMALLMADIDHFKRVNDTHGHQVGDAVLRWVAQLMRNNIRSTDRVARYGGEEIALILPETGGRDAYNIAENLRRLVAGEPFTYVAAGGQIVEVPITMSLGVARLGSEVSSEEALVAAADVALYEAKRRGRNRTVQHTPELVPSRSGGVATAKAAADLPAQPHAAHSQGAEQLALEGEQKR